MVFMKIHYFQQTRNIIWDIAKYNTIILIHLQNMEISGQIRCSRATT